MIPRGAVHSLQHLCKAILFERLCSCPTEHWTRTYCVRQLFYHCHKIPEIKFTEKKGLFWLIVWQFQPMAGWIRCFGVRCKVRIDRKLLVEQN